MKTKLLHAGRVGGRLAMGSVVAVLVATVTLWGGVALADLDFTNLTTQVDSAKSDFITIFKTVIGLVGTVIVVKGAAAAAKKMVSHDPTAGWALVQVGGAAIVLILIMLLM